MVAAIFNPALPRSSDDSKPFHIAFIVLWEESTVKELILLLPLTAFFLLAVADEFALSLPSWSRRGCSTGVPGVLDKSATFLNFEDDVSNVGENIHNYTKWMIIFTTHEFSPAAIAVDHVFFPIVFFE